MTKWFRGFRLKMLSLISISCLLFAGLATYAYKLCSDFDTKLTQANLVRIPLTQGSNEMAVSVQTIARFLWLASITDSAEEFKMAQARIQNEVETFEKSAEAIDKLPKPEFIQGKFKDIKEAWPPLKESVNKILAEAGKGTEESRSAARKMIKSELRPLVDRTTNTIDEMNDFRTKLVTELADKDEKESKEAKSLLVIVSIISWLFLGALGFWIAAKVASVLTHVIQNLSHHSQEVAHASEGLSAAATELSSGATETASSLEETVASTEELNSMVQTNSTNANQASSLAVEGRGTAEAGEVQITELYSAVGDVSTSSKKIEEIINVIDDIAFQTNLLALNAAVEAARAGEQGKGFAVVAEAVRTLAQRSSVAAKDIGTLITDSVAKIAKSQELAEKGKESLSKIVHSIHKISDINAEIATASQEQANGLTSISKAMNEIDKATQQNASASEEISATSEEMTGQSMALQDLVSELVSFVEGTTGKDINVLHKETAKQARPQKKTAHKPKVNHEKIKSANLEELLPLEEESSNRTISKVSGF
jgi:methyl-accepting chemotaxis protein